MSSSNRTVFASVPLAAGVLLEVVRYARAGRWYREWSDSTATARHHSTLSQAVESAKRPGATVRRGLPGGRAFYAALDRT